MSKRILCEKIIRELEGDLPISQDSRYTPKYVLQYVNSAIATAAKKSAYENSNIEGVFYANDAFNTVISNLSISEDASSSQQYLTLPQLPIGLPGTKSLVNLSPMTTYQSVRFKPLARKDAPRFLTMECKPSNVAFYYLEDSKLYFIGCSLSKGLKFRLTMVTSGGDLDSPLNLPPDFEEEVVRSVVDLLSRQAPIDYTNDSVDIKTPSTRL